MPTINGAATFHLVKQPRCLYGIQQRRLHAYVAAVRDSDTCVDQSAFQTWWNLCELRSTSHDSLVFRFKNGGSKDSWSCSQIVGVTTSTQCIELLEKLVTFTAEYGAPSAIDHPSTRENQAKGLLPRLLKIAILLGRLFLLLYRLLPYRCRSLFHPSWPPKISTHHVSPKITNFAERQHLISRDNLVHAGFDSQGRFQGEYPLADVPRWKLEQLMGTGIRNTHLYRQALIHSSALPQELRCKSYERLEFLGDSVLELIFRQMKMEDSPFADEGQLTAEVQRLVRTEAINLFGKFLQLDKWILTNVYMYRYNRNRSCILGDAFEALLGALYLDRGIHAAGTFLKKVVRECPDALLTLNSVQDYKGKLARMCQMKKYNLPNYKVRSSKFLWDKASGTRRRLWVVDVFVNGKHAGSGEGFSKRVAEQKAAQGAVEQ